VPVANGFREVNKWIARKQFQFPKIRTVLQELNGFTYAAALDLNVGYYTIRLDPDVSKACIIILPLFSAVTTNGWCMFPQHLPS
jgi:hypothetical protein